MSDGRAHGLSIRAVRIEDAGALAELLNQPGVRRGTLRPPFQSVAATRQWLERLGPNDMVLVALFADRLAGNAGLTVQSPARRRHAASIGLSVHDAFVGRGVGTALLAALLEAADNWLDIRRVELNVYVDNVKAIRLYERAGFVREGVMRGYALRDGQFVDSLLMARLHPRLFP